MLESGYPEVLASGFAEYMARFRRGGVTAEVSHELEELIGRQPRGLEAFLDDHIAPYQPADHQ
jgi:hypothetical protein